MNSASGLSILDRTGSESNSGSRQAASDPTKSISPGIAALSGIPIWQLWPEMDTPGRTSSAIISRGRKPRAGTRRNYSN
jgi:hypothetical protein